MITECGIRQLKKYCREPIENIKGYREAVESTDGGYHCHHINELTFSRKELKKLNMLYHRPASELVILSNSDHQKWHDKWNGNPMTGKGYLMSGDKNPMFGVKGKDHPGSRLVGEKNPMYGRSTDKNPNWKGDKASASAMYGRAKKLYKSGQITEEEFQKFRDIWSEYQRMRKLK
jgi:hypothetical protein